MSETIIKSKYIALIFAEASKQKDVQVIENLLPEESEFKMKNWRH